MASGAHLQRCDTHSEARTQSLTHVRLQRHSWPPFEPQAPLTGSQVLPKLALMLFLVSSGPCGEEGRSEGRGEGEAEERKEG